MKRIFTICVPDDCYLKVANIVAVVEKNDHSENGMTVFTADNNDEGQEWLFVTNGKAKKVVDLQPIESEERKKRLEAWKNVQKKIYSQIDALDEIHEFRDKNAYFKALDIINKYLKEVEE